MNPDQAGGVRELLPCPFCGGPGENVHAMGESWVHCLNHPCNATGPSAEGRDGSLGWNTRQPLPANDARYPTAHAYEAACAALHKQRERAEKAEAERDRYRRNDDRRMEIGAELMKERDAAVAECAKLREALTREQEGCARILTGSFGATDDWLRHFEHMHARIELALAAAPGEGAV